MRTTYRIVAMIVLAALIIGWQFFVPWMWPPREVPKPPEVAAKPVPLPDERFAGAFGAFAEMPIAPGIADAVRLSSDLAVTNWAAIAPKKEVVKKPPKKAEPPRPHHEPIVLGDGTESYLRVVLDPKGAGVRSVTLNKFQQADAEGLPVWKDAERKVEAPLELIPARQNTDEPSNLLLHYAKDDDDRPLDTLANVDWRVESIRKAEDSEVVREVVFATDVPNQPITITKTYTLNPGDYHIGLTIAVKRRANDPDAQKKRKFRYQMTSGKGLPVEGVWYTAVFRNALIGAEDRTGSLWRTLEDARRISQRGGGDEVLKGDKLIRYAGVAVQYFASLIVVDDEQAPGIGQDFLNRARPTLESAVVRGRLKAKRHVDAPDGEAAYDEITVVAADNAEHKIIVGSDANLFRLADVPVGASLGVAWHYDGHDREVASEILLGEEQYKIIPDDITTRIVTEPIALDKPGDEVVHKFLLYNGPVKVRLLRQMNEGKAISPELADRYENTLQLNTLTDYHFPGWFGERSSSIGWTKVLIFFTNVMHTVLGLLYKVIPNYGICIIILTVLVRAMMHPISRKQALTSMKMQELAPEMNKIKEKYKTDAQARNMAMMELQRRHGVNMFGTCWVVFLQMPIFLGLYYALQESIFFRLSSFLWIKNLAAPDMLVRWGENIWYISQPQSYGSPIYLGPYFNILPVVAVVLMILQQKYLTPPPADEQQAMQQKMMKYMMVFFGVMFYKVAAGLCIYFIASSLWGIAERKLFLPKKKLITNTGVPVEAKPSMLQRLLAKAQESQQNTPTGNGPTRAPERPRRKPGDRPRGPESPGSGSLLQRMRNWWAGVLEEARKK
jgi:YidC/Oxa1 family membrane protein insertase